MGTSSNTSISFEFFPPKTDEMEAKLWDAVTALAPLAPSFVSVTYGAGGSTRERTHHTVRRILNETELKPAAHLTCVAASKEEIDGVAKAYWDAGVRHIVALRGDMPGGGPYEPHPEGYRYAADLVDGLKRIGDFEISVAAFPECHPDAKSVEEGITYLKQKIDAGATRAITQYFFDIDHYFRFMEMARREGVSIPIVPGILPVANFAQLKKFSAMCGASVPSWVADIFEPLEGNPEKRYEAGVKLAAEQGKRLMEGGASHLHFYTLNKADMTTDICNELGLIPL